ncbi:MAG: zinc-ribbon domain containing protein [Cyanobacteria bacterium REEB67]|nr:zinc-ribbon domain containing protein [Cyanobacteria bacterium REEB67]
MFTDKTLVCGDCGGSFVFSEGEQEFYYEKGLKNSPLRCPNCRVLNRTRLSGKKISTTSEVNCANCGQVTRVPFQPSGYKPVYCATCFVRAKQGFVHVQY